MKNVKCRFYTTPDNLLTLNYDPELHCIQNVHHVNGFRKYKYLTSSQILKQIDNLIDFFARKLTPIDLGVFKYFQKI